LPSPAHPGRFFALIAMLALASCVGSAEALD